MNTKIVYVCTSTDEDIYLEQCWASAYSVKIYNPSAFVILLTNKETKENILTTARKNVLSVINEIVSVEIPPEFNKMEKSRWLKTSMRNHISGDFIYIDTDTICVTDLSKVDSFNFSIGGVKDFHISTPRKSIINITERIFERKISEDTPYINSGVMYIKDDTTAKEFFDLWHKNWLLSRLKGTLTDQQSLYATIDELKTLTEMDGAWNCQIFYSLNYLAKAKIIHCFNRQNWLTRTHPLFSKDPFLQIKKDHKITEETGTLIHNCLQSFAQPSTAIGGDDFQVILTSPFWILRYLYTNHKRIYSFLTNICDKLSKMKK